MSLIDDLIAKLISGLSKEEAKAFLEAIQSLKDGIDHANLIDALTRRDTEAVIEAINLENAAFNEFNRVKATAYQRGGDLTAKHIPAPPNTSVVFRFDMQNPTAENWLRQQGADRVTGLVDEQREVIRAAILDEYSRGAGPDNIAITLAGRVDKTSGARVGGVIGLSKPQLEYVQSMRDRLESNDPKELRKISGLSLRDKRFDPLVKKAIETGEPVSAANITEMVLRYEASLLRERGRVIGRSEVGMAVMSARMEAWRQGLGKTGYPEEAMTRTWRHGGGGKHPRAQHQLMNNVSVTGLTATFTMPDGTQMLHALDPNGGAKHCANCTCDTLFEIDYSYGVT